MKRIFLLTLIPTFVFLSGVQAQAALPRSATLATHAVGSIYNAMGTGLAGVISRNSSMTVRVQPYAGPPAWLPSMDTGETDMGIITSGDAVSAYRGIIFYKKAYKNTRIISIGGTLKPGFYVAKESTIQTVADLKGRRVPSDYPGIPSIRRLIEGALATAGLSYNDVVKVPVSDLQAGAQAFLEGRTEAVWHSVGSPTVEEANARHAGGVRFISIIATPEAAKRMAEIYPGSYPGLVKAGSATGIVKDVYLSTNDIYLAGGKALSEEAAYEVVRILWEKNQELDAAYRALKEWSRERMVSARAFIPYHPGAIKFYKEKGLWTPEMEALQASLLGQ